MTDGMIGLVLFALAALVTVPVVGMVRRRALANGHLDLPNERSSHSQPTPSGGGIAIIVVWTIAILALWAVGNVPGDFVFAVVPPALVLAVTGYVDDRIDLSRILRLAIQFAAVAWYLKCSMQPENMQGAESAVRTMLGQAMLAGAMVWFVNLFNFMDGIDGIAASEAVFVLFVFAVVGGAGGAFSLAMAAVILAGACTGFLVWNLPPAKVFLGDVGSACLGFLIGALGLSVVVTTGVSPWILVILPCVFLVDATVTLLRRLLSGQKWYTAHRSHAYQRLAIRWSGHGRVTLVITAVNVCWVLPMAIGAIYLPDYAAIITCVALLPIVLAVLIVGAGRQD